MQTPKISPKQRSYMIMRTYFPELYDDITYVELPSSAPQIPKEVVDAMIKNTIAFIQLN